MVWVHEHASEYGIETRAISAAGWSAGAITALNLVHDATGDRPVASIPAAAVSMGGALSSAVQAGDPPSMMMAGNNDSLLSINSQIQGCDVINTAGSKCEFVAYAGERPAPDADRCITLDVPCTYVLGRDGEHGFFFSERVDVVDKISTFLGREVLKPAGLLGRDPPKHDHHHHQGHHHQGHHHPGSHHPRHR